MTFTHSLLTLEAIDRARSLARLTGGEGYLKLQAKTISDDLLARQKLPETVERWEQGKRETFTMRRVSIPAGVQRRLVAKNRETLRRNYPKAYEAVVTESAPEHAYSARLDPIKSGRASAEWNGYKAEGVEEWTASLAKRFGDREWSVTSVRAATLLELKQLRLAQERRIDKARVELVDFVIENELPLIIPGLGDGRVVLRENGPSFSIDYDRLEKEFPGAAVLITRNSVRGSMRIDFRKPRPVSNVDEEGYDDSDDSGFSVSYTERMRRGGVEL